MIAPAIEVLLYSSLRRGENEARALYPLPRPCTIGEFLLETGLAEDSVTIFFLNGKHARSEDLLSEGDVLSLFPIIDGG